jgi:hypothetical protein
MLQYREISGVHTHLAIWRVGVDAPVDMELHLFDAALLLFKPGLNGERYDGQTKDFAGSFKRDP